MIQIDWSKHAKFLGLSQKEWAIFGISYLLGAVVTGFTLSKTFPIQYVIGSFLIGIGVGIYLGKLTESKQKIVIEAKIPR